MIDNLLPSVLGPILFTLYLGPLGDIYRAYGIEFKLYADDQQVYLSFKPIRNNSEPRDACLKMLQKCVRDIQIWMHLNMLKLNSDKSELIMFGMKQQLARIDICISGTTIQTVEFVPNVGYFMDCFMKNSHHINKISGGLYSLLKDMRSVSTLTRTQQKSWSNLDYCHSLLSGLAQYDLHKLQRVQYMACRVVYNLRKYDHVTANMRNLHWLKICECITYKLASLMFKITRRDPNTYVILLHPTVQQNTNSGHPALVLSSQFSASPHYP